MSAPSARRASLQLAGRLMVGALAGKVLGFAREIEMARLLGASFVADGFRGAITATLLPIAPMQGDLVPAVLIPLHKHWHEEGSAALGFGLLTLLFALVSLPITLAVWVFADQWVDLLLGGFGPEAHALTARFTRVMAVGMPAGVIATCLSCVEIAIGRSRIFVVRASVQNIAVMAGIGLMVVTGNPVLIGWAFVAAMNATALYGGTMLVREGELTLRGASVAGLWQVARVLFVRIRPLLVQPFAEQGNILLERALTSAIGVGALASIDYARTLSETVLFLISQPIGYVVLAQETGDRASTRLRVEALLRPLLALALPASVFLAVFAPDIVTVVLRRGAFQADAVALTSGALRGIAVGLWATTLGWVLIRMMNAAGRNRAAAFILLGAYAANAGVNLAAVPLLGVLGVGLGEATRGLVLLVATACALHSGRVLLTLVASMGPPVVALAAAALAIRHYVDLPLARLALGVVVFGLGAGGCLLALTPGLAHRIRVRLVAFL